MNGGAGWAPTQLDGPPHHGGPQRETVTAWEREALRCIRNRQPCTHWTPDLHGISERPWLQREAQQQQFRATSFLGEQPEVETFCKVVKLDIKIHERHCINI